uniref:FBD domain-containing protein n=1 Tax=Ditylenchus dipsaci TaxID=166011 RepID=A0A915DNV9_9BILA
MTTLDRDLLFEIAQNLVFGEGVAVPSWKWRAKAKYMLINSNFKKAFLSQFSQFKTVCLLGPERGAFDNLNTRTMRRHTSLS